ncbi:MAG: YciI family protein [Acidobacteriota bacterium]
MEFILIAHDGNDEGALDRRLAVRERHLALFDHFRQLGIFKYGGAILDNNGQMVGSVIVSEFSSREELESAWLAKEPYVLGGVWKSIEIMPIRTRV